MKNRKRARYANDGKASLTAVTCLLAIEINSQAFFNKWIVANLLKSEGLCLVK